MTEPWLTKRELAQRLKISTRTVERQRLPHRKVGNQNRYLMSEVETALAGPKKSIDNVIPLRPHRKDAA